MHRTASTKVPLLHSCPGGVIRELIVQDLPAAKVYFFGYEKIKDEKAKGRRGKRDYSLREIFGNISDFHVAKVPSIIFLRAVFTKSK